MLRHLQDLLEVVLCSEVVKQEARNALTRQQESQLAGRQALPVAPASHLSSPVQAYLSFKGGHHIHQPPDLKVIGMPFMTHLSPACMHRIHSQGGISPAVNTSGQMHSLRNRGLCCSGALELQLSMCKILPLCSCRQHNSAALYPSPSLGPPLHSPAHHLRPSAGAHAEADAPRSIAGASILSRYAQDELTYLFA